MGEKLNLFTNVYTPRYLKTIKFTGHHPSRVFKFIPSLLKEVFRVTGTSLFEDDIKWDKTTEIVDFYAQWRVKDGKDARTDFWTLVKVIGEQNSKTKEGHVTIYIHPYMTTKLPYDNFIDKSLAFIYSNLFYKRMIRKLIQSELYILKQLEDRIKKEFGIDQNEP